MKRILHLSVALVTGYLITPDLVSFTPLTGDNYRLIASAEAGGRGQTAVNALRSGSVTGAARATLGRSVVGRSQGSIVTPRSSRAQSHTGAAIQSPQVVLRNPGQSAANARTGATSSPSRASTQTPQVVTRSPAGPGSITTGNPRSMGSNAQGGVGPSSMRIIYSNPRQTGRPATGVAQPQPTISTARPAQGQIPLRSLTSAQRSAISNPSNAVKTKELRQLNGDQRFPQAHGWVKIQRTYVVGGKRITTHSQYNRHTKVDMDVKVVSIK